MAIGIALSPMPVAAVIIIMLTAKARTNAPAFLLGWLTGIITVGLVVFIMPGIETSSGEPTTMSGYIFRNWKDWLIQNNVTVLVILLIVFSTLLIGNGITIAGK